MATYTRGEAAGLLSIALAAPGAKNWLCGWSSNEIQCGVGCSHPQNNLWACGQAAPGATDWNSAGVKNYPTLTEAITAMAANLADSHFPAYQRMVHALQQGIFDGPDIVAGLSTWCGSSCYSGSAGQFIAEGQAHANDQFDDSGGGTSGSGPDFATLCIPCGTTLQCCEPKICVMGQCVDQPTTTATNAINGILPGWLQNPDWGRLGKWVLGLGLMIFGIVLIGSILLDKGANTPIVKQAAKAAAVIGG